MQHSLNKEMRIRPIHKLPVSRFNSEFGYIQPDKPLITITVKYLSRKNYADLLYVQITE